jgi:hypothetical protein
VGYLIPGDEPVAGNGPVPSLSFQATFLVLRGTYKRITKVPKGSLLLGSNLARIGSN